MALRNNGQIKEQCWYFSIEEGQTCTEKNRGGKSLTTMKLECKTEKEGWVQKLKQRNKVGVWGNERMERKRISRLVQLIKVTIFQVIKRNAPTCCHPCIYSF